MSRRTERDAALVEERAWDGAPVRSTAREGGSGRAHGSLRVETGALAAGSAPSFNVRPILDDLPEEQPLTIEVNGRPLATLLCTPIAAAELAAGWVFAQGFFDDPDRLRRVTPYRDRVSVMIDGPDVGGRTWTALLTSGFDASLIHTRDDPPPPTAGSPETPDAWRITRAHFLTTVEAIFARFRDECGAGGFHHAAVGDGERVCAVARDVSCHNAVDKVVGWTLLQRVDRSRLMLCLSGRVSADVAFKAWRAGFPIVASRSLPTAEAVELAHAGGVTLVGWALDARRSVYAHSWRLTTDDDSDALPQV